MLRMVRMYAFLQDNVVNFLTKRFIYSSFKPSSCVRKVPPKYSLGSKLSTSFSLNPSTLTSKLKPYDHEYVTPGVYQECLGNGINNKNDKMVT